MSGVSRFVLGLQLLFIGFAVGFTASSLVYPPAGNPLLYIAIPFVVATAVLSALRLRNHMNRPGFSGGYVT